MERECTGVHEPDAPLLAADDAIQDAGRLQELLRRNAQRAQHEIRLSVPLSAIMEAVEQLGPEELRLLAQRLDERLALAK